MHSGLASRDAECSRQARESLLSEVEQGREKLYSIIHRVGLSVDELYE